MTEFRTFARGLMNKRTNQKFVAAITILCLSWVSPLLVVGKAGAVKRQDTDIIKQDAPSKEISNLIEKFKTADELEREKIIQDLTKFGNSAIPALIKALESDNTLVSQGAMSVLIRIDKTITIPVLIEAMKHHNVRVRRYAALILGHMKSEAKQAVPVLIDVFKDDQEDKDVRSSAAFALGRIGSEAKQAVPVLIDALKTDKNADVRRSAASALGDIGSEAKQAVSVLIYVLKTDEDVRWNAADALQNIAVDILTG